MKRKSDPMRKSETASFFERLKRGMEESIAHSRGELTLKTTIHDYEKMSMFEQIKSGLEDAIAHARGELALKTTTLSKPKASRARGVASHKKRKQPRRKSTGA